MKNIHILLISIITAVMAACSGSDTYRGSWNAMSTDREKFLINFDAKNFSVKDSTGHVKNYKYTQNRVEIKNSVKTYGIQLDDGRSYQIHFPKANNDSVGLIRDDNSNPIYTISRSGFVPYEDMYKLK